VFDYLFEFFFVVEQKFVPEDSTTMNNPDETEDSGKTISYDAV
jgi:hypothetical protein